MRVLFIAHDRNFIGGANRSLLMVMLALRDNYNVDCSIVLPGEGTFEEILKKNGFKCHIYTYKCPFCVFRGTPKDILRRINVNIKYFKEKMLAKKIAKEFSNMGYNLVYTNTRYPIIGSVIAKKLKIPHICHIREFGSVNSYQGRWTYKKIYKASDKVILISNALLERMSEETPREKLTMIHNGISGDMGLDTHELFDGDCVNMLITGRIVEEKGQLDAILALASLLKDGYKNFCLYIAGSSPESDDRYEKKLKQIVQTEKMEPNVKFLGEVENMREIRKSMDIELMCAVCETFGRVTVEGMRNGLLVIGSNTGGTVEIIKDKENGFLYKQGDSESLKNVLKEIYNNKHLAKKVAKNGYEMSQKNFTEQENVKKIYDVLVECTNRGR